MKKFNYRIEQDQYAGNPRDEFDHVSTFHGVSDRLCVGGKKDVEYRYRSDMEEIIAEYRKEKAIIVEFDNGEGTCYAVIERSQLKKEYLDHGYSMRKALYWARRCAEGEIAEYMSWANGEVYGYIVEDEDGNHLDSCWGFYGDREFCEEQAKSQMEYYVEEEEKADQELLNRLQFA